MEKREKRLVLAKETIEVLSIPSKRALVLGGNVPPVSINHSGDVPADYCDYSAFC